MIFSVIRTSLNNINKLFDSNSFKNSEYVRQVNVPDQAIKESYSVDNTLELIFEYGQNDFQPQDSPSVSTGDIILYEKDLYLILPIGYKKLN